MNKKILWLGAFLMVIGCATQVKTPVKTISTTPITYQINESANVIGVVATGIGAETQKIEVEGNALTKNASAQLNSPFVTAVMNSARNILQSNKRITELNNQLKEQETQIQSLASALSKVQTEINEQRDALQAALNDKAKVEKALKAEQEKYDSQWLAGKSHRLIAWIAGIITGLILIDTLLWFFTQSATLNPLTLVVFAVKGVISLISGFFKPKSVLGGFPINKK